MGIQFYTTMSLILAGILVAFLANISVASPTCYPEDFSVAWRYIESDAGGVWYANPTGTGSYQDQLDFCENLGTGATLAAALNDQENSAIEQGLLGETWIGGFTFVANSQKWYWIEGAKGDIMAPIEVTYWNPGQPDNHNGQEECLSVGPSYNGWNDADCNAVSLYALCQF